MYNEHFTFKSLSENGVSMPPVAFLGRMMSRWMQWGTLFGNLIPAVLWEQITLAKSCNLPFKKSMFVGKMQGSLFSALIFSIFFLCNVCKGHFHCMSSQTTLSFQC